MRATVKIELSADGEDWRTAKPEELSPESEADKFIKFVAKGAGVVIHPETFDELIQGIAALPYGQNPIPFGTKIHLSKWVEKGKLFAFKAQPVGPLPFTWEK